MPQVPVYGDRQVRTQALQPVFQNTPDVSSGARALGQGLQQVAEAADRIDLRDAEAKANEVDTQLTRAWGQWENENQGKYTNQAADGYAKAVDEWWREAAKTYGAGLDGRSQAMVGKTLARRQTIALEQAGKYEFAEKEKYADSTTEAAINTATVNALKTGDYAGEAQRIRDLTEAQGQRKNWDKNQRDLARNQRLGVFNTAVVTQLAERDAAQAQKYLTGAIERGEIKPDQQPRLEAIIKGEADNQFATQFAASVANLPLKEQIAKAGDITDPQRREKALTQVKNNYALTKQAEAEEENRNADKAWQLFTQGKRIPEAILAGMAGRDRFQLQEAQRVRAERLVEGRTTVKTDPAKLAELYDMARENPEEFKRMRLTTLTERVSAGDINTLGKLQRDMLAPDKEQGAITTVQAISTYTRDMSKSDAALFQSEALNAIDRFQIDKKRPPTIEERRKLLNDLAVEGVIEREYWIDTKKRRFEMTPEEQAQAKFPTQPQQDKFTVGQVYRDAKGNRSKYLGNGKWEPVK
jgi:hypothetical protein